MIVQVCVCVCVPDLLLWHGAVVKVQSGDVAVCQLLDRGLFSRCLLQLWVHSLDQLPVLRWQPQHLHTFKKTAQSTHKQTQTHVNKCTKYVATIGEIRRRLHQVIKIGIVAHWSTFYWLKFRFLCSLLFLATSDTKCCIIVKTALCQVVQLMVNYGVHVHEFTKPWL